MTDPGRLLLHLPAAFEPGRGSSPGALAAAPGAPEGALAFLHATAFELVLLIASYVLVAAFAILAYEIVRSQVKRIVTRRFEKNLKQFLETPDLYRQQFKFTNKLVVKHQLLADPHVREKVLEYAERTGEDIEKLRERVETYVEEIVPSFSLFSYYRIGYPIARAIVHTLYDPVVDRERRAFLDQLPPDAAPVFVMNHRSNHDFVLLSYVLAGKVSISYAVGEWARVWPLEHLFKSFGSYFVRRDHRDDLYHKVLERYVQLIATHGVTQAIFPEGGLTRDGYLRPAKLGLITWLTRLEGDPDFKRNLVFVPIGVNYDRVIEDHNLIREAQGQHKETRLWKKLLVLLIGPFTVLGLILTNGARILAGHGKLHGHASISFAEPIILKDWLAERGVTLNESGPDERRRLIAQFGDEVMRRIGEAVPATPVTLVTIALLERPDAPWSFRDLVTASHRTRRALEAHGVRIVTGDAFAKFHHGVVGDKDKALRRLERPPELDAATDALDEHAETEAMVRFALKLLRRMGMVRRRKRAWHIKDGEIDRLRYYANSLAHRIDKRWEIQAATPAASAPAALAVEEDG